MSLASPQAEAQDYAPLPMPPLGGWTLLEAADVLCRRLSQIYRSKCPQTEIDVRARRPGPRRFVSYVEELLSEKLIQALCERRDLQLIGYPQSDGLSARAITVPRVHLSAASWASSNLLERPRVEILFSFVREEVHLIFHDPSARSEPRTEVLIGARIETASTYDLSPPTQPQHVGSVTEQCQKAAPVESPANGKPVTSEFTLPNLRGWFRLRVAKHPRNLPIPRERECVAAAQKEFGPKASRELVRLVRRDIAPHWLKKGPRWPRN